MQVSRIMRGALRKLLAAVQEAEPRRGWRLPSFGRAPARESPFSSRYSGKRPL